LKFFVATFTLIAANRILARRLNAYKMLSTAAVGSRNVSRQASTEIQEVCKKIQGKISQKNFVEHFTKDFAKILLKVKN